MQLIYLTFLLLITAVVSSIITSSMPSLVSLYRRLKSRYSKPNTRIQLQELQYQIEEINLELDSVSSRIINREKNVKRLIRENVREYLKELQNEQ